MKKVLIITYYWPPSGGPGVQRALQFARHLPQFGWEPVILTVENGEYPAIDQTLMADIPQGCKVYKTKSAEPSALYKKFIGKKGGKGNPIPVSTLAQSGSATWKQKLANFIRLNLFIPDAKIGWMPWAVSRGKEIIKREKPDLIFSTSPPPTVHLIASKLARWSGLKWVADFRDPWTRIHYLQNRKINPLSKYINSQLEKRVIEQCSAATCVSPGFIKLLTTTAAGKFTVITNGFAPAPTTVSRRDTGKFTILYIGGLASTRYYPELTEAIARLIDSHRIDPDITEIQFIGSIEPEILRHIKTTLARAPHTRYITYVSHPQALDCMHSANLLLLFTEKGTDYEGHIPGKLFEYLSTGNPILCIGNPQGDTASIITSLNAGTTIAAGDTNRMEQEIILRYQNWKTQSPNTVDTGATSLACSPLSQYTRQNLTRNLATLFDTLVN